MRRRGWAAALVVGSMCVVGALSVLGPAQAQSATRAAKGRCVAGSVRWLERWDRAYAGRLLRASAVYQRPGAGPFLQLALGDSYGFPTIVPIVAERLDAACKPTWFRVRVASYPNGRLGWLRAETMATSRIRKRIVVDVSRRRLFFYVGGKLAFSSPAAVGKPGTPTPLGRFYITQRFILSDPNGPYGARALGLSAFSNVLRSWRDGGPVGIHGTNEPFSIGQPVSHGCVRLPEAAMLTLFHRVQIATPVVIRR
ncbi:MAG: L,D-transpeptidase [Actinobacteria bacterium]|nr:L,D-transpeptidase [Actinomycetota bacterium]